MYLDINKTLAGRIGLTDSIVALSLWERVCEISYITGSDKPWVRTSAPTLSNFVVCLSEDQVRRSLRRLVSTQILKREKRNKHPYDMTYSYSFTCRGIALMQSCGEAFDIDDYE